MGLGFYRYGIVQNRLYVDKTDIDEIIDEHLVNGRVVERLKLSDHA